MIALTFRTSKVKLSERRIDFQGFTQKLYSFVSYTRCQFSLRCNHNNSKCVQKRSNRGKCGIGFQKLTQPFYLFCSHFVICLQVSLILENYSQINYKHKTKINHFQFLIPHIIILPQHKFANSTHTYSLSLTLSQMKQDEMVCVDSKRL